ncbi:hypothetical protein VIGAN_11154600 [Vigna angularis var. angularis]|uniref:Uncharacterized protein n=1 Tax=Vigna angularis var. angularis TaxID=157739 RepID=A0A0S3TAU1_PHAAN|nr:hypothetical protein VIGAN_11154600 [Vigna angularis var. angularis]
MMQQQHQKLGHQTCASSTTSPSRIFSRLTPPVLLYNLEPAQKTRSRLDENCRKIVEVVTRKNKMNPILMGVYAKSAMKSFIECMEARKGGVFPCELNGLSVVLVERRLGSS